jgi:hypothetical protein
MREAALKNSVSIVGPPLEAPINEQEYRRVFEALAQERAEGLLVSDGPENIAYRRLIAELATKGRLPTIFIYRQYVEAGGLMSYGMDIFDVGHRVADLADKILKGAKPADLPPATWPLVAQLCRHRVIERRLAQLISPTKRGCSRGVGNKRMNGVGSPHPLLDLFWSPQGIRQDQVAWTPASDRR